MADGSQHDIYIKRSNDEIREWMNLNYTGCTAALSRNPMISEVISSTRQTKDIVHGTEETSGDIITELNVHGLELLFDSCLCSYPSNIQDKLSGSYRWNVGTTRMPFDMIRRFGGTKDNDGELFKKYSHVEVNTLNLTISPSAFCKLTFSILGRSVEILNVSGKSYVSDANGRDAAKVVASGDDHFFIKPQNSGKSITSFIGSIFVGTDLFNITEMQINIDNGLESRYRVGSKSSLEPSIQRANVNGQITAFFENKDLYELFMNEEEKEIIVTLSDDSKNYYRIILHRVKFNTAQVDVNNEGPLLLPMTYQALESNEKSITIDRVFTIDQAPDAYTIPPYAGPPN